MSEPAQTRPTTEVAVAVLDSLDHMAAQLFARLDGITDDEYRWEPVLGMWSVRPRDDGAVTVDGTGNRDVAPAPVTTIAWRLWHLSVDCLDDYTRRMLGDGRDVEPERAWYLDTDQAVAALTASWTQYRGVIADRSSWWAELGAVWGPWASHSTVDMVLHAGNELVHHGAEIALLRDLYAGQGARLTTWSHR
jgi:hypothetical protein